MSEVQSKGNVKVKITFSDLQVDGNVIVYSDVCRNCRLWVIILCSVNCL